MSTSTSIWTEEEIRILEKEYPHVGSKGVSKLIPNKTRKAIRTAAFNRNIKIEKYLPVNDSVIENFIKIKTPEVAYFLGFCWADGHIRDTDNNISLAINNVDGENIKDVFLNILPFNITVRKCRQIGSIKPTMNFSKASPEIHHFLKENDYIIKSFTSPNKILSLIPEHFKHYWWRGYFDGDGCLYLNHSSKNIHPRICISGPKNQCWNFYKKLCNILSIKFKTAVAHTKLGSWSKIYIQSIRECFIFLDFIYQGKQFGLSRKYKKYLTLKNTTSIPEPKKSKYIGVCSNQGNAKKPWRSFASLNLKYLHCGDFASELEAAKAREEYILKHNLSHCRLNFT